MAAFKRELQITCRAPIKPQPPINQVRDCVRHRFRKNFDGLGSTEVAACGDRVGSVRGR
jgi:hypothetical protein